MAARQWLTSNVGAATLADLVRRIILGLLSTKVA